jgi:uncharacterized protein involved in exopolysaccharide biosynthesis
MSDPNTIHFSFGPEGKEGHGPEEVDLFHYLQILKRHRRLIAGGVALFVLGAFVVSLFLPPVYEARTSFLPRTKERSSSLSAILGKMNSVLDLGAMAGMGGEGDADRFINILESRVLSETVVRKLDLLPELFKNKWDGSNWVDPDEAPSMEDAIDLLTKQVVTVGTNNHGLLTVTAQWRDPEIAASIANAYVDSLAKYLKENDLTVASRHKDFVQRRLVEARTELATSEDGLRLFCETNGVISLTDQTHLLFEQITALYTHVAVNRAEVDVLKRFSTASNPELIRKQAQIDSMLRQIQDLERGGNEAQNVGNGVLIDANGFIPLYKLPKKSLEYARLLRDVKVRQNVFTYLQSEFESARIAENREAISFVRLDRATRPRKPIRPVRSLIVGLAGIVSCLAMFLLASFLEYMERRKREEALARPPSP